MNQQQTQEKLNQYLNFLAQDELNAQLLTDISALYQELNDFESAQIHLDKAKTLEPDACISHQGLLYLNQGQLTHARDCFLDALSHEDTSALRYNLGFCYFMTFEFDKALDVLMPVAEQDNIPEIKILIARILHREGDLTDAVEWVKKILIAFPNHAEALGLLSLLYFDLNKGEQANEIALTALASDSHNYDAQCVNILTRLLTQQTTIEEIEKLLETNPEDCRMWFALGNTHMFNGELQLAEEAFQKAVAIYSEFYDCIVVLAWCQLLNNKIDQAQANYQKATELAHELSDGWSGLALVHVLKEEFLEAEQLINKATDINEECFLAGVAEAIHFTYTNPQEAKANLLQTLKNTQVPIGEKLAFILDELQTHEVVH